MVDRRDLNPDESDGVEFVDLDDSLPARRRPTQNIETEVQEILRPRLWEVYRRVEIEREPAKDVAVSLGVSRGRVSQMLSEAKRDLARDPKLREIWDDPAEVTIHPPTPRRPT